MKLYVNFYLLSSILGNILHKKVTFMQNFGARLKEVRLERGLTRKQLGDYTGDAEKTIYNYETGKSAITLDFIVKASNVLNVDYSFLAGINNKMSISEKEKEMSISEKENIHKVSISEKKLVSQTQNSPQTLNKKTNLTLNEDSIRIPFYENIIASAGQGYINEESQPKYITFSKSYLRDILGIFSVNNLSIITSSGDSMHPTIPTNCNVIIEHTQPKNGDICVTRIDDELYIKRLQKLPKMRLLSDNTNYEAIDLETQNYEIIGKVLCYIKRV